MDSRLSEQQGDRILGNPQWRRMERIYVYMVAIAWKIHFYVLFKLVKPKSIAIYLLYGCQALWKYNIEHIRDPHPPWLVSWEGYRQGSQTFHCRVQRNMATREVKGTIGSQGAGSPIQEVGGWISTEGTVWSQTQRRSRNHPSKGSGRWREQYSHGRNRMSES